MIAMKFKIALCALLLAMVSTTASAQFTSEEGWTGWDGWDDNSWGWNRDKQWDGQSCPEKPQCEGKDCDEPSPVPSPTAAMMGLGAMGLMLTRRGSRRN